MLISNGLLQLFTCMNSSFIFSYISHPSNLERCRPFLPPSYVPANPEYGLRWAIDCSYKAKPVHEEPSPNKLTRQIIYILTSYVYFFVPRKIHPYSPTPRRIRGVFLFRVPFESNLLNIFIFFYFVSTDPLGYPKITF